MRTVIIGSGPVGMLAALARADRGDEVVLVERDDSPDRRGVMQYRHPHFFRPQMRLILTELAPQVWEAAVAAGGIPASLPGLPPFVTGLACRRAVFEEAFRAVVDADPRVQQRMGEATAFTSADGRVTGVVVDGFLDREVLEADLVLCCAGRSSTLGDELRPPLEGGPCGNSYVSRMYRTVDGTDPFGGDWFPRGAMADGYLTIVFPQDDATHSALIVRATGDRELAKVQTNDAFDRAAAVIPNLATWTDPARFTPITDVLKGGLLTNLYRGQGGPSGLFFVGDAVSTTSPMAGRGGVVGLGQVAALMPLLDTLDADAARVAFDAYCTEQVRPWYEDHVQWDASMLARWAGQDIDVEAPLSSDVICAAAAEAPEIAEVAGGFGAMLLMPQQLHEVEERAREVLRTGWRPPVQSPSRAELLALI
jgi:2-polyprenyl-6-methoxyphenol hydroxylase-like FAD-dependent oxidoreductase